MVNLNSAQRAALDDLERIDRQYRDARATAKIRAKRLVEQELAGIDSQRAQAAFRAYQLRVPKQTIGKEGLHTTDPATLNRILLRFAPDAPLVPLPIDHPVGPAGSSVPVAPATAYATPPAEAPRFEWIDRRNGIVRVRARFFPTISKREGFPETLEGVVQRDTGARSGWSVLEDPTDTPTEYGPIPGFLRDEVDRNWFDGEEPEGAHLPTELDRWAEANR